MPSQAPGSDSVTRASGTVPVAWRFSTRDLPPGERQAAWTDAMARLRLPFASFTGKEVGEASVTVVESAMGLQFSTISAGPLVISGRSEDQVEGLWIGIIVEGDGRIRVAGEESPVGRDLLLLGVTRTDLTLTLDRDNLLLLVRIPQVAIGTRLLARPNTPLVMVDARGGMPAIFFRLLEAAAREIDRVDSDQLRPVELAVVEFVVATLAESGGTRARGGADGARASMLYRIQQRLETMLGEPDLTVEQVAESAGVSPRYLRRLFAAERESFSGYLKARRLERCRLDLASPLHAQLGVSEIAFRWGFNDAAHFSRSFRERFGQSPREFRRSAGTATPPDRPTRR